MKVKLGIFALVALGVAVGIYTTGVNATEAPAAVEEAALEAAVAGAAEEAVLPWEDPFLRLTSADEQQHEPTEPQIIPKVWCCKPDGNCAKIKQTKCANIGGVQHRTEAACYNDPNC